MDLYPAYMYIHSQDNPFRREYLVLYPGSHWQDACRVPSSQTELAGHVTDSPSDRSETHVGCCNR